MTVVYELLFENKAVYYGVTDDIKRRLTEHGDKKFDDHMVIYHGEREECLKVERVMISRFNPIYNTIHRSDLVERQKKIKINPLMLSEVVSNKVELDVIMFLISEMDSDNVIWFSGLLKEKIRLHINKGNRTSQRALNGLCDSGAIERNEGKLKGRCYINKKLASLN